MHYQGQLKFSGGGDSEDINRNQKKSEMSVT